MRLRKVMVLMFSGRKRWAAEFGLVMALKLRMWSPIRQPPFETDGETYSDAMSITKRYLTSLLIKRS
jgi:hypothetical protein